jgi:2-iminobutanoate/2-iminopropanoate deaminase
MSAPTNKHVAIGPVEPNESPDSKREEYRVPGLPEPVSHYVDAVRWGNQLFVSGVFAVDSTGLVIAPNDVRAQAEVVHQYLSMILTHAGTSLANVLHLRVYLTDIKDRALVNEVRKRLFGPHRPASTLVEISALALDGLVLEIDAIVGIP